MIGLCHMQICAKKDIPEEEIIEAANRLNPSGTSNGWVNIVKKPENCAPRPCDDDSNRIHYLLVC